MSINMSNVKAITLGGQNAKKIEDKTGNVLWKVPGSTTGTINVTIGSLEDFSVGQYYNRIVLPSISTIKSRVASAIGVPSSDISVTKIELDLSTLYWYNNSSLNSVTSFSLTTTDRIYFGRSEVSGTRIQPWGTSNLDITNKLSSSATTSFYGYYIDRSTAIYTEFNTSNSSSYPHFCKRSSKTSTPTFTIVVSYEY